MLLICQEPDPNLEPAVVISDATEYSGDQVPILSPSGIIIESHEKSTEIDHHDDNDVNHTVEKPLDEQSFISASIPVAIEIAQQNAQKQDENSPLNNAPLNSDTGGAIPLNYGSLN
uniref:Uncharacterized protein n=1 Tax=Romanomermis culicivorax TaxID=13658 RepID=A0A915HZ15_ROMCU